MAKNLPEKNLVEQFNSVIIGFKYSDPSENLYANYLSYCKGIGYKPLLYNVFSVVLLQQLNSLLNKDIYKKEFQKVLLFTILN